MKSPARVEYRVRASVGGDLYGRILREAAVRRLSVSHCIRADLQELYAIRDELSRPITTTTSSGGERTSIVHRLLAETETRLAGDLGRQLEELGALRTAVHLIELMLDRQYLGLMLYLPELPAVGEDARARSALRRYEAWKEAVHEHARRARLDPPAADQAASAVASTPSPRRLPESSSTTRRTPEQDGLD